MLPAPIESFDLPHPAVPPALDGLTILHLSDLHVHRAGLGRPGFRRLRSALSRVEPDLIVLTGDYMTRPGDERAALTVLGALAGCWRSRSGAFGIFGNHDSATFARLAASIPGIRWLVNRSCEVPGLPLRILGASYPEDLLAAALEAGPPQPGTLTIALTHYPTEVFAAAELGVPMVFAGHTHGGQIRFSTELAPHTSSDFPPHLASGMLRLRQTICCVSRGLGEAFVELRVNCPPQAPLYRLRLGPAIGGATATELRRVVAW